jgi:chromosome partitioning protein
MKNIAVIARKGGSGKTTVAVNLAIAAFRRGHTVQIADIDPQASAAEVMKARKIEGPTVVQTTGEALYAARNDANLSLGLRLIDTPAGTADAIAHAIGLAQVSLLVVRPTFLDLAATLQTAQILRRLRRPGLILLNQAPVPRGGVEPPAVKRALDALRLMQLPVVPLVLRSRAAYQTGLALGRSVEETGGDLRAAEEVAALWSYVERFALGAPRTTAAA